MKHKRILITGCAGSIGSELVKQLCGKNAIYGLDINETGLFDLMGELGISGRVGDIREDTTVRDIFSDFKPQVVFHVAAYKHVTPMESTPLEAIKTNILGLYNVLHYAKVYPVEKFVFISTDKAVNPYSIMGATKRLGEIITKNQGKGFVVVRFGNVMGSRGSVIPIWQKQLDQDQNVTVTDSRMERYMMTIEEASYLVIQAAEIGQGGEIIILDMGQRVKVLDLAKKIVQVARDGGSIEMIGARPGEQFIEKIMFEEEEKRAVKQGKFWVVK